MAEAVQVKSSASAPASVQAFSSIPVSTLLMVTVSTVVVPSLTFGVVSEDEYEGVLSLMSATDTW